MTAGRRTEHGGRVDRNGRIAFRFDNQRLTGLPGDTLASALLANGVKTVGRSVKYHRKRGLLAIGSEEPNALIRVGTGVDAEPNTRATMLPLVEGLKARSQNSWPSVNFDVYAIFGKLGPLLSAGFYYKTFMWPRRAWMAYERIIRNVAGLGECPAGPDSNRYEHAFAHCDVLVVGAGPAGLRAARVAADAGADVWLVDEDQWVGGWLNRERAAIDNGRGIDWVDAERAHLDRLPNVRVMTRTTAFGYYDHNLVGLVELLPSSAPAQSCQRLWRLRACQVVLATGAIERPFVFPENDLPGIMLAGAVRGYANQYGVLAGSRMVVCTNNDSAYRTAMDVHDVGITVAAVVDNRKAADPEVVDELQRRNIPLLLHHAVVRANGRSCVRSVSVRELSASARTVARLQCDLLAVSAGWSPAIHLHAQSGGTSAYDEAIASVRPAEVRQATHLAGAAYGHFALRKCMDDGARAGVAAAAAAGFACESTPFAPRIRLPGDSGTIAPMWDAPASGGGKAFVDLQNDVTSDDVGQAYREGYQSVEHLKRYTTLGMGTDQGKTSNVNGLAILAGHRQEPITAVGTTTFRPPFTPVTLGAIAGPDVRDRLDRVRRSPLHDEHEKCGAEFDHNGLWLRPKFYPANAESPADAIHREARIVRSDCGVADVSTLGKFEVQGPDAGSFLERVYANSVSRLVPGRTGYGLMLREDGIIFDDGTVTCLGEGRYFLTVSTSHAEQVHEHLEYFREFCCAELKVAVTCVTEYWGAVAVAGPRAAALLQQVDVRCAPGIGELSHMSATTGTVAGLPARLLRVSFSGEWACEIYVPARRISQIWRELLRLGAIPYGLEAMDVLRIEKGFISVGAEANGRTTPIDLGFARMVGKNTRYVGQHGLSRIHRNEINRLQLVGLIADDPSIALRQGSQLLANAGERGFGSSVGHISSAAFSPVLGRCIALALLQNGRSRMNEIVYVADPIRGSASDARATVCPPCFFDPDGKRLTV